MKNQESSFMNIIGGNEQEKAQAREEMGELFTNPQKIEELREHSIEISELDRKIIEESETGVNEIVRSYGGTPIALPENKIHVLKPGSVKEITNFGSGVYFGKEREIAVERHSSDIIFSMSIAHELLHLKSFKSAIIAKDGAALPFQSGIMFYAEESKVFHRMEEAIVAESNKKFYESHILDNPRYVKEIDDTAAMKSLLKPWFIKIAEESGQTVEVVENAMSEIFSIPYEKNLADTLSSDKEEEYKLGYLKGYVSKLIDDGLMPTLERSKERKELYDLLDNILEKSNGRFNSRDEVFDEFAKANFSGNLKPLVKTLNEILGEGSISKIAGSFSEPYKK